MSDRIINTILTIYTLIIYSFLLIPPFYLVYLSFFPEPSPTILVPDSFTLTWFESMLNNSSLMDSLETSIISSLTTAIISATFAVLLAKSYLKLGETNKQRLLIIIILPILIPSIVMGLALTGYFRIIGLTTGWPTLIISGTLWGAPICEYYSPNRNDQSRSKSSVSQP